MRPSGFDRSIPLTRRILRLSGALTLAAFLVFCLAFLGSLAGLGGKFLWELTLGFAAFVLTVQLGTLALILVAGWANPAAREQNRRRAQLHASRSEILKLLHEQARCRRRLQAAVWSERQAHSQMLAELERQRRRMAAQDNAAGALWALSEQEKQAATQRTLRLEALHQQASRQLEALAGRETQARERMRALERSDQPARQRPANEKPYEKPSGLRRYFGGLWDYS